MMRIPALYDTVILTTTWYAPARDEGLIELLPLTQCKVIDVRFLDDARGLCFELDALDAENRGTLPFTINQVSPIKDGCYPFVVFPPSQTEASYWSGRVFDALDASILRVRDDLSPDKLRAMGEAFKQMPRGGAIQAIVADLSPARQILERALRGMSEEDVARWAGFIETNPVPDDDPLDGIDDFARPGALDLTP